jgi:uncharacterized glyoxalase superfamily protein PhnB
MTETTRVTPMIHVPDVKATVEWYASIGFEVRSVYEDSFAVVSYGAGWVYFSEGGKTSTAERREVDLYVQVDDLRAVYDRVKDRVTIEADMNDTFYGTREFIIRDLNGFWITFGQTL